jgi:hypothetical protein
MSTPSSQLFNSLSIEASRKYDKEKYDLRMTTLNSAAVKKFRSNYEQGVLGECFAPIIMHYVLGTFDEDWAPSQNMLLALLVVALTYFRFQTFTEN